MISNRSTGVPPGHAPGDREPAGRRRGPNYCCSVTATAEIYTPTLARVAPDSGPAGQAVTVSGSGFFAGEQVQVTFDNTTRIGKATTGANGTFVLHTGIPAAATAGNHTLTASGQRSFAGAQATFTVT